MTLPTRNRARRNWLHRLGRAFAVVTQLVFLFAPIAEGREDRPMDPHVEAPRTKAHPGHQPSTCAECVLLTMHGRVEERSRLPEPARARRVSHMDAARLAGGIAREPSNSSRAPPTCV
ncbi:MAG: hypothetical protein M3Z05_19395 [Gemmatimonadota bacterium]|nr:hypothetical protein [Gemmatimonadota bacterium]